VVECLSGLTLEEEEEGEFKVMKVEFAPYQIETHNLFE
jgi:hypothetical protein